MLWFGYIYTYIYMYSLNKYDLKRHINYCAHQTYRPTRDYNYPISQLVLHCFSIIHLLSIVYMYIHIYIYLQLLMLRSGEFVVRNESVLVLVFVHENVFYHLVVFLQQFLHLFVALAAIVAEHLLLQVLGNLIKKTINF